MPTKIARMTISNNNPVGMIVPSMLTEAQFQAINGPSWVLADGRNVAGSVYATTTGQTNVPDLRGMVLRGKNNGRSDGNQDPGGERALGNFQNQGTSAPASPFSAASAGAHGHILRFNNEGSIAPGDSLFLASLGLLGRKNTGGLTASNSVESAGTHTHTISGGDVETRPRNIAINYFIKINN